MVAPTSAIDDGVLNCARNLDFNMHNVMFLAASCKCLEHHEINTSFFGKNWGKVPSVFIGQRRSGFDEADRPATLPRGFQQ